MQHSTYTTDIEQPYDLFGTLRFARMGKADPTFILTPDRIERAFWFEGEPVTLTAQIQNSTLFVKAIGSNADAVIANAPALLGWQADNFTMTGHPLLDQLSERYRGLRKVTTPHLGYDLIQTVLQQLIEWREAANIWRRMVHYLGQDAPGHQMLRLPPSYETIAKLDLPTFQKLGLSMKRGALVKELGRIGHRLDAWQGESTDMLRQRLLSVPGIGPWTVDHCLGFSLNAPDVVPLGDYQLPHTVCWALANEDRASDDRMLEVLKPWAGQRWSVLRLIFASNMRAPRRGPRIAMGRPSRPRVSGR